MDQTRLTFYKKNVLTDNKKYTNNLNLFCYFNINKKTSNDCTELKKLTNLFLSNNSIKKKYNFFNLKKTNEIGSSLKTDYIIKPNLKTTVKTIYF